MGLVIDGRSVEVPGLPIRSYLDDPALRLPPEDRRRRGDRWVRSIIFHTSKGLPVVVRPGTGPDLGAEGRFIRRYREQREANGCHGAIDCDASTGWFADAWDEFTWHAKSISPRSVGIEIYQTSAGEVWEAQLDAAVLLADALTALLGIQRQIQDPYERPQIERLHKGGRDAVGVFGHYHWGERGPGDPGEPLFTRLRGAGYEPFDFAAEDDLVAWRIRQAGLRVRGFPIVVDGIPGPATTRALRVEGRSFGMWVERPMDDYLS